MNCDTCIYGRYRRMAPQEPRKASLALVGEAPGDQELIKGTPFIGPSGELLRKTLVKAGLTDFEDVYFTNAMLCRPPRGKQPKPEAVKHCQARLIAELQVVEPKLVICLGNMAMWSVTDNFKTRITAAQGRMTDSPFLPGTKVLPCIHPSAVLRSPGQFKNFFKILEKGVALHCGKKTREPGPTDFWVIDSMEAADLAASGLRTCRFVAADIETTGFKPWANRIIAIGVCTHAGKVVIFPEEFMEPLKDAFDDPNIRWGWQNGKFDVSFLRRRGYKALVHEDSMLLHYCLNETTGTHDLEQLAAIYLGATAWKKAVKEVASISGKVNYGDVPTELLYEYLAKDVDYTYQLIKTLRTEVNNHPGLRQLYERILIPASEFLRQVERRGMWAHKPTMVKLQRKFEAEIEEYEEQIQEIVAPIWDPQVYKNMTGAKSAKPYFVPTSTKQLAWYLYDMLGLKPKKRKKRSTAEGIIEEFRGRVPVVDLVLKLRSAKKSLKTYVTGPQKRMSKDGRVHTVYKIHGTVTGRLSSTNPNVQNIPRDPLLRGIYQAPPGRMLLELDYKGAELRTLAYFSKDEFLTRIFLEGRDLHTEVAIAMYGANFTKDQRVRAKALNFGIPYGREAFSIAQEFDIPVSEAQQMIDDWLNNAPQARDFLFQCARAPREGRVLVTPFGRERRFGLVTAENVEKLEKEARNFPIQSVTSDFTLLSGIHAQPLIEPHDAFIINDVHDSLLIELPDSMEVLHKVAKIVADVMRKIPVATINSHIPFEVDVKYGYKWGDAETAEKMKEKGIDIDPEGYMREFKLAAN